VNLGPAESERLRRVHLPGRLPDATVREADRALLLDGGGKGLLDTTHFDTVRFPPPPWAASAVAAAEADGKLAYTPYRGHPGVLDALAGPVSELLGVPVDGGRHLALTPGTQAGLFTTMSALVDPGDLVLVADPEYLFSERMLAFLGARVERVPVHHHDGAADLDLDAVERLLPERPRLMLFSHPHNPTGAVHPPTTIARLARLAVAGGFRVLVDQLYCRLVHDDTPYRHLVAEPGMADRTVTLIGPSKTESLSGYRLGVVVGPEDVIDAVEQTLAVTSLRAPAYAQQLLRHWLVDDHEFLRTRLADLRALRETTVARLREVPGLRVARQAGTAYAFPDVSALGVDDRDVAAALRRDAGVIVSPGYQFGPSGIGHFRVCYARDEQEWDAALDRIVGVLRGLAPRG
jgi:aspartate/methionine/tyrosine aminotransferase